MIVGHRYRRFQETVGRLAALAMIGAADVIRPWKDIFNPGRLARGNSLIAEVKGSLAPFGDVIGWSHRQYEDFCASLGHPWLAQVVPAVGGVPQFMTVVPASFFTTPDWAAFANELKGVQEVIRWTMYSYKAYPVAGVTNLLFFDQSEGIATNGRLDTNMTNPGSLPGNEMLIAVGVGFDPIPANADTFATNALNGVAAQQWYNVLTQGFFENKISGKEYFVVAPLTRIPPGHGLGALFTSSQLAANVQNIAQVQSGSPDNRAKYNVDPPFGILPQRPFEARIRYNTVQPVTTAGRVGTAYDGWKVRPVL